MPMPSGMPIRQARTNAPNTRAAEIPTCARNGVSVKPLVQILMNLNSTACGDGRNSGLTQPIKVNSHQTKMIVPIEAMDSHIVSPCPGTP